MTIHNTNTVSIGNGEKCARCNEPAVAVTGDCRYCRRCLRITTEEKLNPPEPKLHDTQPIPRRNWVADIDDDIDPF